jgi:hypothetical protein
VKGSDISLKHSIQVHELSEKINNKIKLSAKDQGNTTKMYKKRLLPHHRRNPFRKKQSEPKSINCDILTARDFTVK